MSIKRVLLPLADHKGMRPLAEAAFLVGRLQQAQVCGLLVQRAQLKVPFAGEYMDPDAMRRIVEDARKQRGLTKESAKELFQEVAKRFQQVEDEFSALEGDIVETVGHAARLADISILDGGAHYDNDGWLDLRDATLFHSGRPVLTLPRSGLDEAALDRVVVAWKESIQAARAVAAAQPFLVNAKEVHLVSVGKTGEETISLQDVEEYLQLHYADVRSEVIPHAPGEDVGRLLLDKAEGIGGLLVMGAYSRWRWREQIFGGVTEAVLHGARTPVLMMH
jgi:nucleotide-binding universal stress UspA family protein